MSHFVPISDYHKARELYHAGLLWWIPENLPCEDMWPVTFRDARSDWPASDDGSWVTEFGILLEE